MDSQHDGKSSGFYLLIAKFVEDEGWNRLNCPVDSLPTSLAFYASLETLIGNMGQWLHPATECRVQLYVKDYSNLGYVKAFNAVCFPFYSKGKKGEKKHENISYNCKNYAFLWYFF